MLPGIMIQKVFRLVLCKAYMHFIKSAESCRIWRVKNVSLKDCRWNRHKGSEFVLFISAFRQ